MARETVITYDDVLGSIRAFNKGLEQSKRFREQIPFFQSWYYVPELDAVGPSKFIRYKDMTWLEYIRDHSELDSRMAEPVLSKWFKRLEEKSAESIWVRQRVDRLLGGYGKTVNSGSKFSAPTGWGLMGEDKASHPTNIRATTNTGDAKYTGRSLLAGIFRFISRRSEGISRSYYQSQTLKPDHWFS